MKCTQRVRAASLLLASTAAIFGLLVASCNNEYGIFQNVQDEVKQAGTEAFQKNAIKAFLPFGQYYFVAPGSYLYERASSGGTWTKVTALADGSLYYCRGLVSTSSSRLYALIETGSSDSTAIALYSSSDGASWSKIDVGTPTEPLISNVSELKLGSATYRKFYFDALFAANGELYLEGHVIDSSTATHTNNYYLYRYSGGAFKNISTVQLSAEEPLRGVAYFGSKYYFASLSHLLSGSSADGSDAASIVSSYSGLSSETIWGLSVAGSYLYITTKSGTIYRSDTSTGLDIASIPLTKVVEVPLSSSKKVILVGTDSPSTSYDAIGYYEASVDSSTAFTSSGYTFVTGGNGTVTGKSSIYSTTISTFPVHDFYYLGDSSSGTLFACISPGVTSTSYYGLYSDSYSGAWVGWSAE
jgi:hypothetical protein